MDVALVDVIAVEKEGRRLGFNEGLEMARGLAQEIEEDLRDSAHPDAIAILRTFRRRLGELAVVCFAGLTFGAPLYAHHRGPAVCPDHWATALPFDVQEARTGLPYRLSPDPRTGCLGIEVCILSDATGSSPVQKCPEFGVLPSVQLGEWCNRLDALPWPEGYGPGDFRPTCPPQWRGNSISPPILAVLVGGDE